MTQGSWPCRVAIHRLASGAMLGPSLGTGQRCPCYWLGAPVPAPGPADLSLDPHYGISHQIDSVMRAKAHSVSRYDKRLRQRAREVTGKGLCSGRTSTAWVRDIFSLGAGVVAVCRRGAMAGLLGHGRALVRTSIQFYCSFCEEYRDVHGFWTAHFPGTNLHPHRPATMLGAISALWGLGPAKPRTTRYS